MRSRRPNDDAEVLLEAATTAVRGRDVSGRIQPAPAWVDLSPEQCEALFERQWEARLLERAASGTTVSSTGSQVLQRAGRLEQFPADED
jgi:hypothetical protein